ncbi:hypothetical protein, partial [Sphingosinicella sp. YJ22]|uniref:hypothetical protein n=1 Tax=Sphingosinicella sp. YJ22 TaxID=1104780 RepID=UPI001A9C902B
QRKAAAAAEKQRRRAEKKERERLAAEAAAARLAAEQAEAREREEAERAAAAAALAGEHAPYEERRRPRQLWPWLLLPVAAIGAAGIVMLAQPDPTYSTFAEAPAEPAPAVVPDEPSPETPPVDQCDTLWTQSGSAPDPVAALRDFIASCPGNANLAEARTRLQELTAPVIAPRQTDGRWSIAWSTGGTDYSGTMSATSNQATIIVEYMQDDQPKRVRQRCVIEGEELVSIRCSDPVILSGPDGYSADSFTLRFTDDNTLQGAGVDVQGTQTVGVVLRRL